MRLADGHSDVARLVRFACDAGAGTKSGKTFARRIARDAKSGLDEIDNRIVTDGPLVRPFLMRTIRFDFPLDRADPGIVVLAGG